MALFTPEERTRVRDRLLELARADARIVGAALTGSAARGDEDRWSDVDLFLGIAEGSAIEEVIADWTDSIYRETGSVAHWDVRAGAALYRVFLLGSCLQVDVAFTPAADFGARGPSFRTIFGEPVDLPRSEAPRLEDTVGLGWLGVLHAHKAIERGKPWEAEHWISTVRDQTLSLACVRLGESPVYAGGADRLPPADTGPLEASLIGTLEVGELRRALGVAARCLVDEIRRADAGLAARLDKPLLELAGG